jgi:hypothetical protein
MELVMIKPTRQILVFTKKGVMGWHALIKPKH